MIDKKNCYFLVNRVYFSIHTNLVFLKLLEDHVLHVILIKSLPWILQKKEITRSL